MFEIFGKQLTDFSFLGALEPQEVLYDFDGPRVFTSNDADSKLLLAYQSDESAEIRRFIIVPFSESLLSSLKAGSITLLEALDQPRVWIADLKDNWTLESVWLTDLSKISTDRLPKKHVMLWPNLQPKFALRVVHDDARLGHVPSNIIQGTIERVKKSFRILADHVSETLSNAPSDIIKNLLNPPAQRFAYRSFEVAFQMPIPKNELENKFLEKFESYMIQGFSLVQSNKEDDFLRNVSLISETDRLPILAALKELAPSSQSQIKEIEISGRIVNKSGGFKTLTPDIYRNLRKCVLALEGDTIMVKVIGKIKQCDRDKFLFDLREISSDLSEGISSDSVKCHYELNQEEEVLTAFSEGHQVKVSGIMHKNTNILEVDRVMRR